MLRLSSILFRAVAEEQQDKERSSLGSDVSQQGAFELAQNVIRMHNDPSDL